jgi:hypothetical protein
MGYKNVIQHEYYTITKKEEVTKIAQITINNLCNLQEGQQYAILKDTEGM